jgi:hypothetical protein
MNKKQEGRKHWCNADAVSPPCFSSESGVQILLLAGLLAFPASRSLPIRRGQTVAFMFRKHWWWLHTGDHSYGDSAGLSPDFPFNRQGKELLRKPNQNARRR